MPRCAAWDPVFLLPPGLAALGTSLQGRGLQHVAPSWTPAHSATTLRDDAFSFQNAPGFPLKQLEHQLPNLRSSGAKGKAAGLSGAPPQHRRGASCYSCYSRLFWNWKVCFLGEKKEVFASSRDSCPFSAVIETVSARRPLITPPVTPPSHTRNHNKSCPHTLSETVQHSVPGQQRPTRL